jgi:ribosomal protein S18 acetylase RimI-like enzyme
VGATGAHRRCGDRTEAHHLGRVAGVGLGAAKTALEVTASVDTLAAAGEALAGGRLSMRQAAAVTSAAQADPSAEVTIERFSGDDLGGVLALCRAEGWPSLPEDPARALRALTAPGVTTIVARDEHRVIGLAPLLSDGEIQAYLATLAVDAAHRRAGIGRRLVEAAVALAGGARVDLLAEDAATEFYDRLPHKRLPGFRLYPPLDEPLPDP